MEEKFEIKNLLIAILIIVLVLGVFYAITVVVTKNKKQSNNNNNVIDEAVIDYDSILVSDIYSKNESEYYVFADFKNDESKKISSKLSDYEQNENITKVYNIDMTSAFNKNFIKDESDLTGKYPVFSKNTLLKIQDKKIVESYEGTEISTKIDSLNSVES